MLNINFHLVFIKGKPFERKDLTKKISTLKSPAKIKKYNNKLRKTYDRIIIKPEDYVVFKHNEDQEHSAGEHRKQAHWRKGHFRMQPYGAGSSKRKVIYIKPTLVAGIFANKKSYSVRTK